MPRTPRLADLINAASPPGLLGLPDPNDLDRAGVRIAVLVADAVAEHFFAEDAGEDFDLRSLGCCLPPADRIFVEMARPSRVVSSVTGITPSDGLPALWGWFVELRAAADLPARLRRPAAGGGAPAYRLDLRAVAEALLGREAAIPLAGREARFAAVARSALALGRSRGLMPPGWDLGTATWVLHAVMVAERGGRLLWPARFLLRLDATGRVAEAPISFHPGALRRRDPAGELVDQMWALRLLFPAMQAFDFAHRDGIVLRPRRPDTELASSRRAAGLTDLVAYLELELRGVVSPDRN